MFYSTGKLYGERAKMESKRDNFFTLALASFVITTLIFIAIFSLASSVSYLNYKSISAQNNILTRYLADLENVSNNLECNNPILLQASEILDSAGSKLSLLESRFGKNDKRVLEQKKIYSKIELRHFEIVKKVNEECEKKFLTVLFFYSNKELYKDESDKVGFILGTFKNEYKDKVMIYALDYDLGEQVIDNLAAKYLITKVPVVIVNEKDLVYVDNIRDLEVYSIEK